MDERIEHLAETLLDKYREEWDRTWAIKDFCRVLVEHCTDAEVRAIAKAARMSHRTIFAAAVVAKAYPEDERVECLSPRTHAVWYGQRKKEAADGQG